MSKSKIIQGKFVNKYKVPLDQIEDFNIKYDNLKKSLPSHGPNLAGAIKTELGITNFFQTMDLYDTLVANIQDFIKDWYATNFFKQPDASQPGDVPNHHIDILSVWVNDMKSNEYNPIHHHNERVGFSTVLFLKLPGELIDDYEHKHKNKDGRLYFYHDNTNTEVIPHVGDFYVFRADHAHGVYPFRAKDPEAIRRSMSFNFTCQIFENAK
mgnify:FL=1|tara:strand:- start:47 stop:679 length:633 start_codon:yes stop_codon:yes gene_type:complete